MGDCRPPGNPDGKAAQSPSSAETGNQRIIVRCSGLCRALAITLALLAATSVARAGDILSFLRLPEDYTVKQRYLYSSLYTKHYDPEPEHVNDQNLLGFEIQYESDHLWGFALFDNSFGQQSQYLYIGRKYRAFGSDRWYYKLTGGLLHGYDEPYENRIPLNELGIAPAIIPGIGYQYRNINAEFVQLALSGLMITVGFSY